MDAILLDKRYVDLAYKNFAKKLQPLEFTKREEVVTAIVRTNLDTLRKMDPTTVPYFPTVKGQEFAYQNPGIRQALEELGNIADLGGCINACIASCCGAEPPCRFATLVNASELIARLKPQPSVQRIAKNAGQPVTSGLKA